MAKVISFSLSPKDIDRAVKELRDYQTVFKEKCEEFRKRVAERIRWSAEQGFSQAVAGDTFLKVSGDSVQQIGPTMVNGITVTTEDGDGYTLIMTHGKEAVFIEYGAGVRHNGAPGDSPHPWGIQQGFAIGAYPLNHDPPSYGVRNVWGYYDGDSIILTHGTPAAMPMYRGAEEAIRAIDEIAREVFG